VNRRTFIAGLGAATTWPLAARAQQGGVVTIGMLFTGTRDEQNYTLPDFFKGLREMGFVDGRNLAVEYRYADDRYDQLPALANDLVQRRVAVIRTGGGDVAAQVAKAATTNIPIIFHTGGDPVEAGLLANFNHPGGNVTGISFMNVALAGKRLGLLRELVPSASRFAMLVNPGSSVAVQIADAQAVADILGQQIKIFTATTNDEIDTAFAEMAQWRAEALLIGSGPLFASRGARQLATLAIRHALPAIQYTREFVEVGGLASYGSNIHDTNRLAGIYVGRVLKGEKPSDLPVMQPTRFELLLNLATAKAIGLDIPPTMLALADDVIE